jgi:hypothetical protein
MNSACKMKLKTDLRLPTLSAVFYGYRSRNRRSGISPTVTAGAPCLAAHKV